MLDIQYIRDNPELVQEKSKQKGCNINIARLLEFDAQRRAHLTQIEELRRQRNEQTESLKGQKPTEELLEKGRQLKDKLGLLEDGLRQVEVSYFELLRQVPNMPLDDVPIGASEEENITTKEWGEKPKFDFEVKNHWQIGEAKGWIDKGRASKIAGSR